MSGKNFLAASMLAALGLMPSQIRADAITLEAPIAGASVHAGGVDMAVYYVDRGDHFEVVATYAESMNPDAHGRLRMGLADGDLVRFGLPGVARPVLYTFHRQAGTVSVDAAPVGQNVALLMQ